MKLNVKVAVVMVLINILLVNRLTELWIYVPLHTE